MQMQTLLNVDYIKLAAEFKDAVLKLSPVDILKILAGLGSSYVAYKALRIYLHMRKYKHIPGPETEG
jgi:hypothetical protein